LQKGFSASLQNMLMRKSSIQVSGESKSHHGSAENL